MGTDYETPTGVGTIGAILVGALALVGMILPVVRDRSAAEDLRGHLDEVGVVTTARVTKEATIEGHVSLYSNSGEVTTREEELPMRVRLDAPVSAEAELGTPGFPGFKVGDRVQVVYDPETVEDESATVLLREQVELGLDEAALAHERRYPDAKPTVVNFPWYEIVIVLAGLGLVAMTPVAADWASRAAERRRDRRERW